MANLIECYDVGGTNIRGAIFESSGKVLMTSRCKTIRKNKLSFIKQIEKMSELLRKSISKNCKIKLVTIALPGYVEKNILINAPVFGIKNLDVAKKLKRKIKEPIFIINDVKAATRAELKFGIGKTTKNFYVLTISTGIGSGLVLDKKVVNNFYGEFGHDVLERDPKKARLCNCKKKGCWQAMASGYALEKIKKPNESWKDFYKKNKKITKQVRDYNAHGIGNMLNAFSVDKIVIMGSMGIEQFKKIVPNRKEIEKYTYIKVPEIVPTKLGDTIGLLGAYIFALEKTSK
ncbi:MAG: ROK family protein [Candidatus Aenigmarchaeota archaeon]|nr:ROK family protein [Candidatus Aenigmarchaeota archaeon]